MLDVGYKNFIDEKRVKRVMPFENSKAKWLRKEAIAGNTLIDCTQGRKTNCILILRTGHLVLSSLKSGSIIRRIKSMRAERVKMRDSNNTKEQLLDALSKKFKKNK